MNPIFPESVIQSKVKDLGKIISLDYEGEELVLIGILNGSFIFLADLCRQIQVPHRIDFLGASSYGEQAQSSGKVEITKELQTDISGKSVLIVEDIVDTGLTLHFLKHHLENRNPKSLKIVSLFWKKKLETLLIDYVGFEVENEFLVGYGLDYAGRFRHLPYVTNFSLTHRDKL